MPVTESDCNHVRSALVRRRLGTTMSLDRSLGVLAVGDSASGSYSLAEVFGWMWLLPQAARGAQNGSAPLQEMAWF